MSLAGEDWHTATRRQAAPAASTPGSPARPNHRLREPPLPLPRCLSFLRNRCHGQFSACSGEKARAAPSPCPRGKLSFGSELFW